MDASQTSIFPPAFVVRLNVFLENNLGAAKSSTI
jgi:hypothetical protein